MCNKLLKSLKYLEQWCENEIELIRDFVNGSGLQEEKYNKQSKLFEYSATPSNNEVGIYIFIINNACKLKKVFDDVEYGTKTNKNLTGNSLEKGDCLYLGKSEEDIKARVNEHLVSCPKNTYSLRLFDEKRSGILKNLTCFYFVLKNKYKKHKKFLLPHVENKLHDILKPKVGTRRS